MTDTGAYRASQRISATCAFCKVTIKDIYFHVDGKVACVRCKAKFDAQEARQSGTTRFLRALGLGFGAAAVGAGASFGVHALAHRDVAAVAVVTGLLVGLAVRAGSRRRGGWRYRSLAVALTWLGIAATWVPFVRGGGFWPAKAVAADTMRPAASDTAAVAPLAGDTSGAATPTDTSGVTAAAADSTRIAATPAPPRAPGFGTQLAQLAGAPLLAAMVSLWALLFNGAGLGLAWALNKGVERSVTGPFRLGYGLRNTPVRGTPVPPV